VPIARRDQRSEEGSVTTLVEPAAEPRRMTLEEFEAHAWAGGDKVELVRGEVRVTPAPGLAHSRIVRNVFRALDRHVDASRAGEVFGDGTGFVLALTRETMRIPDVSFVRAGRLPDEAPQHGAARAAPDLAVEVLSPSETWTDVMEKVDDLFAAGTAMVWVVDARRRRAEVLTPDGRRVVVPEEGTLDGGDVLPGFTMPVATLFTGVARER
jgi:Uma2 family endonuclease